MHKLQLPDVTLLGIDCINIERIQEVMNISQLNISFGESKILTSLPTDDYRRVEIPHIGSHREHSRFCIEDLYKYVDTDYVLVIEHDGFVLNADSWEPEFKEYDYIGAPWFVNDTLIKKYGFPEHLKGTFIVGNGGFSLRSRKLLKTSADLAGSGKLINKYPEDNAICIFGREMFENAGIRFAPADIGLRFSIEGENNVIYKKQFGFHNFKWTNIDAWINQHPEYTLTKSNYERLSKRGATFPPLYS